MNSQTNVKGPLSVIDRVFSMMDSQRRPLDFTLLLHLKNAPGLEALRTGARSARNLYPATGSYIDQQHWIRLSQPGDGISVISVSSTADLAKEIEEFIDGPLDLHNRMPVQQLVVVDLVKNEVKLATRFHHAVADGLSAAMWISHQLRVAHEKIAAVAEVSPFQILPLRSHPSPVKKSRYAYRGPSNPLWTTEAKPSRARRWRTIEVAAGELREGCRRAGGFTYNDLLATCTLEVFSRWNGLHSNGRPQKVGLWLPVNIRQRAALGFGNGTSRIRLYPRYDDRESLPGKCREIRRQVSWSNRHGEWATPTKFPLDSLPPWVTRPLLLGYLRRPGIDMATGVFSHADRGTEEISEICQQAETLESIGLLHAQHPLAINGATSGGRTWLTFTYDPGLLSTRDIEGLVEMYQEQLVTARREFQ
ncbi:MAG TPA: hypothetical protein VEW46_04015 [Pyrinomonadaceae bacterium]|nr:hypothetical protein [Pyrinomonadaceae bacterium]